MKSMECATVPGGWGKKGGRGSSDAVNSVDPNQKLGPSGVGNASWLPAGSLLIIA